MAKLVSATYGDALFQLAVEEDKLDTFAQEIAFIKEVFAQNEDLIKLIHHPKVVKEEKIKVVESIFTDQISKDMVGFLVILINKDRAGDIEAVFDYFDKEMKEYKNIGTAYVTTAVPLTQEQKKQVEKRLLETTKYVKIDLCYEVDESLIAGMMIRIGDRVVDSSVKTKLHELSRELLKCDCSNAY